MDLYCTTRTGTRLKDQLTQALATASKLQDTKAELQAQNDALEKSNVTLNNEVSRTTEEVGNLKRELAAALEKSQKYRHKAEPLSEQVTTLFSQKTDAEKEVAVSSQSLDATKIELRTAQDTVTLLTDENKIILQEKTMIQGQFKRKRLSNGECSQPIISESAI